MSWSERLVARVKSLGPADLLFALVLTVFGALVVVPWWSSRLLPLMDYPMFLSFVRVFLEHDEPGSAFFGTYTLGPPVGPLVLPIAIVAMLSKISSIEFAGRTTWTLYALLLPASAAYLGKALGQSRWNVVLVFPLAFGLWTSAGFFGFVTGMPIVLFAYGAAIRFLDQPSWKRGALVSLLLAALAEWHTVSTAQALLGVGIIWCCWRAPSVNARLLTLWPVAAPALLIAIWMASERGPGPAAKKGWQLAWDPLPGMFDTQKLFTRTLMSYPEAEVYAKIAALALIGVLLLGDRDLRYRGPASLTKDWYVSNPMGVIAFVALVSFFTAPTHILPAQAIGHRFVWMAAVFLTTAWSWPSAPLRRNISVAVLGGAALLYLFDVNRRFRQFDQETIGASRLMDSIPKQATLIAPMKNSETQAFTNHPVREIQQYPTIRNGVLPESSFAGYGVNYVRFVEGNPKPALGANWLGHRSLVEYDYVLLRAPAPDEESSARLRFVKRDGEWQLFEVCGSKSRPSCG